MMVIQTASLIIIIILLGYIIYMHFQLSKRNIFIETTLRKISGIENSRNMDEIVELLQDIPKLKNYSSFSKSSLSEETLLNFMVENEKDLMMYMHYTKDLVAVENILLKGFQFTDSFYKTALRYRNDRLDILFKHNSRKHFGEYLIIIGISTDIANFYSLELKKAGIRNYSFENVLTESPPVHDENSDPVYRLPVQFIKGYINHRTGEVVNNLAYDPWYNSPFFIANIDLLKTR